MSLVPGGGLTVATEDQRSQESKVRPWTDEEREVFWRDWDEIAAEINASWPKSVSAHDGVSDVRREL